MDEHQVGSPQKENDFLNYKIIFTQMKKWISLVCVHSSLLSFLHPYYKWIYWQGCLWKVWDYLWKEIFELEVLLRIRSQGFLFLHPVQDPTYRLWKEAVPILNTFIAIKRDKLISVRYPGFSLPKYTEETAQHDEMNYFSSSRWFQIVFTV